VRHPPTASDTDHDGDTPQPPATGSGSAPAAERSRRHRRNGARLAVVTAVIALGAMWIYAFVFAPRTSPDRMPDRAWGASAEALCATNKTAIDALPSARSFKDVQPRTEALRQRADVGEQATNLVAQRVAALRALTSADARTVSLSQRWLRDYDTYIADRRHQVDAWRAGEDKPFAESANERKQPASDRMDAFARLNRMPSCAVPLDIG
jgi:hypothetical protein